MIHNSVRFATLVAGAAMLLVLEGCSTHPDERLDAARSATGDSSATVAQSTLSLSDFVIEIGWDQEATFIGGGFNSGPQVARCQDVLSLMPLKIQPGQVIPVQIDYGIPVHKKNRPGQPENRVRTLKDCEIEFPILRPALKAK